MDALWTSLLQHLNQICQRTAGVYNVLHNQDILAFQGLIQVLYNPDHAAGHSAAAVAGHGHKVQGHRNRHPLCQFAGKEYSAL